MFAFSKRGLSNAAMAVALALGTAGGFVAIATPAAAKEAAPKLSKGFTAVAGPLQAEIGKAKDPAAAAALKPKLDAAFAAAQTMDDKFFAGQFAIQVGQAAKDNALMARGLQAVVDSGKLSGPDLGKYQFFLGNTKLDTKDYAGAQAAFAAAIASGYRENDVEVMLAESYFGAGQNDQGFTALAQAIEARKAAGNPAPQEWFARGISVAYRGKQYAKALPFAIGLAEARPTKDNWADAISITRMAAPLQAQETLDLMRLMRRTDSFRESSDFSEYLQAADARRLPAEVLKVIEMGVASGKLSAGDVFVTDNRTQANARLAADKSGLPALDRDARVPSAATATVMAAADAQLSYDDAAKAAELYALALNKPGVDADRALTRLGIAQTDLGKYAEAQATFAKVNGVRKPIAQLWSIYAAQKAKGG